MKIFEGHCSSAVETKLVAGLVFWSQCLNVTLNLMECFLLPPREILLMAHFASLIPVAFQVQGF